ncbi:hypothetical protein B296_00009795 [Ensete ventricosum]|uniref:Uncharacterized protein n=1 Tax=Ensete ventricosum TaxID=4639 RepID=A0A427AHZ7_ENSVE|nr:hypothetical protein B296_00009795 [Ensete ventricosum]
MKSPTKSVLVLALLIATTVVQLEGRNIKTEPKPYKPQNFFGFGGVFGTPSLPLGPQFGFRGPAFGSIPTIGTVPGMPGGGGLIGRGGAKP